MKANSTTLQQNGSTVVHPVKYRQVQIEEVEIFYREAGAAGAPTLLLLHGFPASSHMFRDLIPQLADCFHLIAPDLPGFGYSDAPPVTDFDYTFDHLADVMESFVARLELEAYSLYVMDYGAPVGFRLATRHPERVQTLIVQNGNAYQEGIDTAFWEPVKAYWNAQNPENEKVLQSLLTLDGTKWQYLQGVRDPSVINPDAWHHDQSLLDRPGNAAIQLALFYDYRTNPISYSEWQQYFRSYQPPTLIVWGKNDPIFPVAAAHAYRRDLTNIEFHLFDTGHFALEEDANAIASLIQTFLQRQVIR